MALSLSGRLRTAADMIAARAEDIPDAVLCDVGCDHAYLPISLIEEGIVSRAIAMDVNEGPLLIAKSNIRDAGLDARIETRRSDGLAGLWSDEADIISLCGMGGRLMISLIRQDINKARGARALLLQPQSDYEDVRRFLFDNGFCIGDESIIKDEGKYYFFIMASPAEGQMAASANDEELFLKYGRILLEEGHPLLRDYLYREKERLSDIRQRIPGNAGGKDRLDAIEEEQRLIERALGVYYDCK